MRRRVSAWLLGHLPETIAAAPERVLINLSCALIGLSVLFGNRSPVLDGLWPFPLYEWATTMLVGGLAVLVGMFTRHRTAERLGLILLIVGCLFYGALLLCVLGKGGAITAMIFLVIAVAKGIRLAVSSAARSTTIRLGEDAEGRDPPPDEP